MKQQYLGDSYDAVKCLWQNIFAQWAPLYTDPKFVAEDVQDGFTALTKIPVLGDNTPNAYSILNDPDTGIWAPGARTQDDKQTHLSLTRIKDQLSKPAVRCVITYDQSFLRSSSRPAASQRQEKLGWLACEGVSSFFYVSHAPFLFAFATNETMEEAENLLLTAGIPRNRLEHYDSSI